MKSHYRVFPICTYPCLVSTDLTAEPIHPRSEHVHLAFPRTGSPVSQRWCRRRQLCAGRPSGRVRAQAAAFVHEPQCP